MRLWFWVLAKTLTWSIFCTQRPENNARIDSPRALFAASGKNQRPDGQPKCCPYDSSLRKNGWGRPSPALTKDNASSPQLKCCGYFFCLLITAYFLLLTSYCLTSPDAHFQTQLTACEHLCFLQPFDFFRNFMANRIICPVALFSICITWE